MHSYSQIKYLSDVVEFLETKEDNINVNTITDDEPGKYTITFEHYVDEDLTSMIYMQIEYDTINNMDFDENKILVGLMAVLPFSIKDIAGDKFSVYNLLEKIREHICGTAVYCKDENIVLRYNCISTGEMNFRFYVALLRDFLSVVRYVNGKFVEGMHGYIG